MQPKDHVTSLLFTCLLSTSCAKFHNNIHDTSSISDLQQQAPSTSTPQPPQCIIQFVLYDNECHAAIINSTTHNINIDYNSLRSIAVDSGCIDRTPGTFVQYKNLRFSVEPCKPAMTELVGYTAICDTVSIGAKNTDGYYVRFGDSRQYAARVIFVDKRSEQSLSEE